MGLKKEAEEDVERRVIEIARPNHPLYKRMGDGPMIDVLMKVAKPDLEESAQNSATGRKQHPFNMRAVIDFQVHNIHHSTCIHTKKESCVGLGFESEDVFEELDPYCEISFSDVLGDAAEDFFQTGNGYIEVVRNEAGDIRGLHHIRAQNVFVFIEDEQMNRHYEVVGNALDGFAGSKHFAQFGDLERFNQTKWGLNQQRVSEVIHFRRPTSLSRWYGFPDWLAATASIELVQALTQHQFDFFLNRGVPEFILTVIGPKRVSKENWEKIEKALKAQIGMGNSRKSVAWNLVGEDYEVQIDKLALEHQADAEHFTNMMETLATHIVSAHRVPPLLAGILVPGKLGATNELPNALASFQALVMGPAQRLFSNVLAITLGNSEDNGDLSLDEDDFRGENGNGFRTILGEIGEGMGSLTQADTMSRMRETMPEAMAGGRNLEAGVLSQRRTATPGATNGSPANGQPPRQRVAASEEQIGEMLGNLFSVALEKMMEESSA